MRRVAAFVLTGLIAAVAVMPALAQSQQRTEVAQATRPRIVITPRRHEPGPNAKRECEARLVQQHRPSGTVIVPVMNCWWQ
ncbi:MAG: hypothetical protein JSR61_20295 [Proteobacteria bacterium]|nr:hypothetical protein [Pseudomonadota bacterium]